MVALHLFLDQSKSYVFDFSAVVHPTNFPFGEHVVVVGVV
jgi:hypothetical protein